MCNVNVNLVQPYGYFLTRKSDNMKYVGVRYGNVKKNLTPAEDFGKVYFTSGRLEKDFKANPENYTFKIKRVFSDISEMFEWERKIALRIYKRPDWANQGWATNYGDNPEIGKLISEGKVKIKSSGQTSVEEGAEKLVDWIYNTADGAEYRKDISERMKASHAARTYEERQEISRKRLQKMDPKAARAKAQITRNKVQANGLTLQENITAKMLETCKSKGVFEENGKNFSDWCKNTEEGRLYVEQARIKSKEIMDNLDPEVKAERVRKANATKAAKSPEEKQKIAEKIKASKIARQKKLGEMSDEEFTQHIEKFSKRGKSAAITIRKQYLLQLAENNELS